MPSPFRILDLDIENFKSFRGKHHIEFSSGLNCITGPNGAGKSVITEAICFVLGDSNLEHLRIKSFSECVSFRRIDDSDRPHTPVINLRLYACAREHNINATYSREQKKRVYRLNNRLVSLIELGRFLRSVIGLNTGVSFWHIAQNQVHKIASLDGAKLAAFLCEASGTKYLFDNKTKAEEALVCFEKSAAVAEENINNLKKAVEMEANSLKDMIKLAEMKEQIKSLNEQIKHIELTVISNELQEATKLTEDVCYEKKQLATRLNRLIFELGLIKEKSDQCNDLVLKKTRRFNTLEDSKKALELLTAELNTCISVAQNIGNEFQNCSASKEENIELSKNLLTCRSEKEKELAAFQAEFDALQVILHTIQKCSKASQGDESRVLLPDFEKELAEEIPGIPKHENLSSIIAAKIKAKNEYEVELNELKKQVKEEESSLIHAHDNYHPKINRENVRDRLRSIRFESSRNENRIDELILRLPEGVGKQTHILGDLGCLVDVIEIKPEACPWMEPLGFLLSRHLPTRLCSSYNEATALLNHLKKTQRQVVIWPLEELKVQKIIPDSKLAAAMQKFGSLICNPSDLISWTENASSHIGKAVRRALGDILLVESDAVGESLLKNFSIKSISKTMNFHSHGILTGGYFKHHSILSDVKEYQKLQKRRLKLQQDQKGLEHELQLYECMESNQQKNLLTRRNISHLKKMCLNLEDNIGKLNEGISILKIKTNKSICDEMRTKFIFQHKKNILSKLQESGDESMTILRNEEQSISIRISKLSEDMATSASELDTIEKSLEECRFHGQEMIEKIAYIEKELSNQMEKKETLLGKLSEAAEKERLYSLEMKELETVKHIAKDLHEQLRHTEIAVTDVQDKFDSVSKTLENAKEVEAGLQKRKLQLFEQENECCLEKQAINLPENANLNLVKKSMINSRKELLIHLNQMNASITESTVDESSLHHKENQIVVLGDRMKYITSAITNLREGLSISEVQMTKANNIAFSQIGKAFQENFSLLVPTKRATITPVDSEHLEKGVAFGITNNTERNFTSGKPAMIKELSGGQATLLGFSYLVALAKYNASSLYILDEVDAALDERNQCAVLKLIKEHFSSSQVILISHHHVFHERADKVIRVYRDEETSKIEN